jgi:CBS domain-containing protein
LGFHRVYNYVAGKLDWLAAGLPTEGANSAYPRAGDVARRNVPTCGLTERLGDVADRVHAAGWNACVVINAERVVLGLLRAANIDGDPDAGVEQAMRPGPSTYRPFVSIRRMAKLMRQHNLVNAPVTTSDGRLVGLLLRDDAESAAAALPPEATERSS